MTNREPIEVKNLDQYGNPPLEWSAVLERLEGASGLDQPSFLGTVSPDGRSHIVPFGPAWYQGQMYFTSGPGTLKSRNLARNPSCSIAGRVQGMDLVLEGTASIVTDDETLEALAAQYRETGWPAQVEAGAFTAPYSAQSAGPPPWNLYRLDCQTAHAVTVEEPYCATLWRF
jgi:nitroimidazol reductase NimA-like FMN-containing flavoprotein (pyridoxamine 5'-phosphate oxidase superfamily)